MRDTRLPLMIATLLALGGGTVAAFLAGIWTEDRRWAMTGGIGIVLFFGALFTFAVIFDQDRP